jgi:hypothetical protein
MSSLYNDMPGDLREKIHLWEVLNKILKNNGYVGIGVITTELNNLKNQINVLLSDVLGLEHEIDGIHNYDDGTLNTKIDNIEEGMKDLEDNIKNVKEHIDSDVNGILARIQGINNTSSKISLQNLSNIEVSTMNSNNHGTKILLSPQQISIQNVSESPIPEANPIYYAWINLGGAGTNDGITMESDNFVTLNNRLGSHHLSVKSDKVDVSDINGLKISSDATKITITYFANTHVAHIPWESD